MCDLNEKFNILSGQKWQLVVKGLKWQHKDLFWILDELSSLKLWKEKQERKEKGKKIVEEKSQDERKKIREEERRKITKEMKRLYRKTFYTNFKK